jgi:hypothetical protein
MEVSLAQGTGIAAPSVVMVVRPVGSIAHQQPGLPTCYKIHKVYLF